MALVRAVRQMRARDDEEHARQLGADTPTYRDRLCCANKWASPVFGRLPREMPLRAYVVVYSNSCLPFSIGAPTLHSIRPSRPPTMSPLSLERCAFEFRETATRGVFPTPECLKFGISKGLSLGIVAGAVLVKVPQILRIVSNKSVNGLRVAMFRSEVLSGTVAVVYFVRQRIAIAAYAEIFFILAQNLVILWLIAGYGAGDGGDDGWKGTKTTSKKRTSPSFAKTAFTESIPSALTYVSILTVLCMGDTAISDKALESLYNATTLVLITGRAPQIYANHVNKSTGELSVVSQALMCAGALARIFTTAQEGGGNSMLLGYGIGAGMNCVIFGQMLVFAEKKEKKKTSAGRGKRKTN